MKLGRNTKRRIVGYGSIVTLLVSGALFCTSMPGCSFRGPPPPLDARETTYEAMTRRDVGMLAGAIGERNTRVFEKLRASADYIEAEMRAAGYAVTRHPYAVGDLKCETLDVEIAGARTPGEIVVVAAHYDSVLYVPGADDNGSGVAGTLALARTMRASHPKRTIRFAFVPNEEPPYFAAESMGSLAYARELKARGDDVVAMLSLESIGYFSDAPGSQQYPPVVGWLYPSRGNFVAFVGDLGVRGLVRDAARVFRASAHVPSEGGAIPASVPGVGWSDHRSFRAVGYPAIMVTDTAVFRNRHYHQSSDTPETLDYANLARVVAGLEDVVATLSNR